MKSIGMGNVGKSGSAVRYFLRVGTAAPDLALTFCYCTRVCNFVNIQKESANTLCLQLNLNSIFRVLYLSTDTPHGLDRELQAAPASATFALEVAPSVSIPCPLRFGLRQM